MDLSFSPAEEAFRAELRAWLAANLPPDWRGGEPPTSRRSPTRCAFLRDWQRQLADGGWVGHALAARVRRPRRAVVEHYSSRRRWRAARAPEIINRIGVNLVGPTLIAHGTEEQKPPLPAADPVRRRAVVPALLRARRRLRPGRAAHPRRAARRRLRRQRPEGVDELRAVRALGHPARAHRPGGAEGQGHQLPDLRHAGPGITVRPLRQMTGGEEFNEVFLEDVFIPREHLVGASTTAGRSRRRRWRTSAARRRASW